MTINGPKPIFFIVLAACTLTSCVSDTSDPEPIASRHKVAFDISSLTRGSVTNADNIKNNSFVVFGDLKYRPDTESKDTQSEEVMGVLLDCEEVRYNPDSLKWICTSERFWHPNAEHSFVAIHPATAIKRPEATYSNNSLSFKYLLSDIFTDTPDLLAATHRRKYQTKSDKPETPVKFRFLHAMSKINLTLHNGTFDKIKIKKIELERVNKSGVFTITPASLTASGVQTDDYFLSWTDLSDKGLLTAVLNIDVDKDGRVSLFPDHNALFMIPQPENKDIIMKITYADIKADEETLVAVEAIGGWEQGKIYSYSVSINATGINVDIDVTDWQHGSDDEVYVPRK